MIAVIRRAQPAFRNRCGTWVLLETAIADLIDNSISAGAGTIDIICDVR